ncbi:protein artemis-like isoform X2 [Bacillus rossius redtenbacheri]|uniref:protein artemis-like isoform X2 n=1 Tax=Bacillus rossius redtenbacheri TaxID=93214 RepID=UPI002FDE32D2
MSSFDGIIREFNVAVDFFKPTTFNCLSFFLSHCHSDHTNGLREDSFIDHLRQPDVYLYCSDITAHFLVSKFRRLSEVKDKIVALQPSAPSLVRSQGVDCDGHCQEVTVSTIPAGHCPGSVMFLFEGEHATVLYTGDFRLAQGDVCKLKQLHVGGGAPRAINTLYLDTTFLTPRYWTFPAREQSVVTTCQLAQDWMLAGPHCHVVLLLPAWTGTEYLFVRVAKHFNTKIHVLPGLYSILRDIPEVFDAVTDDNSKRIHAVMNKDISELKNHIGNVVLKKIQLSAKYFENTEADRKVTWCEDTDDTYSRVCYSSHCSFSELRDFVRHLRPRKVFPCVRPFYTSGCEVKVLLQELGVPQVDLSIFAKEQVLDEDETASERIEAQRYSFLPTVRLTENKTVRLPVMEELVDSPPPKRKHLQHIKLDCFI